MIYVFHKLLGNDKWNWYFFYYSTIRKNTAIWGFPTRSIQQLTHYIKTCLKSSWKYEKEFPFIRHIINFLLTYSIKKYIMRSSNNNNNKSIWINCCYNDRFNLKFAVLNHVFEWEIKRFYSSIFFLIVLIGKSETNLMLRLI